MSNEQIDVSNIKAGDQVTARMKGGHGEFSVTGTVYEPPTGGVFIGDTALMLSWGSKAGPFVVEIVEHIPAVPEWTTWPLIKAGETYLRPNNYTAPTTWLALLKNLYYSRAEVEALAAGAPIVRAELRVADEPVRDDKREAVREAAVKECAVWLIAEGMYTLSNELREAMLKP